MKYRKLGNSDLNVSEISLGSWLTYSGGVEKEKGIACVHRALDLGINFIDTANVYGRGVSETLLGEVLATVPRKDYILATKLYFPMSDTDKGLSRAQVFKQVDDSLKRLRTDYLDLYQCHRYDDETPLEETMQALSEIVRAGKVRWIGFSEWPVDKIKAAAEMPGMERFVSSQPQYSLMYRAPEKDVIPYCAKNGISQIVWSPLAQGVLTGKYQPGKAVPADSRAGSSSMGTYIQKHWLEDRTLEAVSRLRPLAQQAGLTLGQFALAWVLREPNVASAIVGASRPEQVDENAGASGANVDPALFAEAEKIIGAVSEAA